jgi:hypothetical protein
MGMRKLLLILLFPLSAIGQTPLHKLTRKHASAAVSTPFITSNPVTASPRNNFSGSVGFAFTVGGAGITITDFGRWVISGNSGTHDLRLTDASGITLISTSINTSGLSVGYNYVPITPTFLAAGTYYYFSDELNGGDQWYDSESYTCTAAATLDGSYYIIGLGSGNPPALAFAGTNAYVPVNFKYY